MSALNVYNIILHSEVAKILIQYFNELVSAEVDEIARKPKGAWNKRGGQHGSDFVIVTLRSVLQITEKEHACHLVLQCLDLSAENAQVPATNRVFSVNYIF